LEYYYILFRLFKKHDFNEKDRALKRLLVPKNICLGADQGASSFEKMVKHVLIES
jgi:hypothetical protein